jgi:hypothetical protein
MKTLSRYSIILFAILPANNVSAQQPINAAIHISSPLGLLSKGRVKAELRFGSKNALLAVGTSYWGLYPCYTAGLEYRRYYANGMRSENYLYGSGGAGHDIEQTNMPEPRGFNPNMGTMTYVGAGVGRHINFSYFFIDMNAGIQATTVTRDPEDSFTSFPISSFYITGPGAVVRLNFCFGFQSQTFMPRK